MRKLGTLVAAVALLLCGTAMPRAEAKIGAAQRNQDFSLNWSGYAVQSQPGERIDAVSGSWIVPTIRNAPPGYSASWVGIGGFGTDDLIQAGTSSSGHLEQDYAWYEVLPDSSIPLSGCAGDAACTVSQGDRVATSVTNVGGNAWVIAMSDYGRSSSPRWSWAITVSYASTYSSAEWVFEAPSIGPPPIGPVGVGAPVQTIPAHAEQAKFLGGNAYRVNGVMRQLYYPDAVQLIMVDPATGIASMLVGAPQLAARTATPSWLGTDGRFAVCAYKRDCPLF